MHLEEEISKLNQKLLALTKEEEKINGEKKMLKERSKYEGQQRKTV